MNAEALAHSNIALVKYWGKLDTDDNIPAVGSISVTLSDLSTRTAVSVDRRRQRDRLFLDGRQINGIQAIRTERFLNQIRKLAASNDRFEIHSTNNFPTASGLASSASGYAALALAASNAAGLNLTQTELCALARFGSGSASRSMYGGFVEMTAGRVGANRSETTQLADEHFWPISVLVAVTDDAPKPIGSREAMAITQKTSPFYPAWVASAQGDLDAMRRAIRRRDLLTVGTIAEHSALKLHGMIMACKPGIFYWNPGTMEVIQEIHRMRNNGIPVFFSIDAGPQVKTICDPQFGRLVSERLQSLPGVKQVIRSGPGPSARLIGES